MSLLDNLDNEDMVIQAVEFQDEVLLVHFQEKRHVGPRRIRSSVDQILMDTEVRQEQYLRLQEMLRDLVDGTYDEDDDEY